MVVGPMKVGDVVKAARDAAFCLSQLSYSLPSIKRLLQRFPVYEGKLGDPCVYQLLQHGVVQKTRKFAKVELKAALDELEGKLSAAHNRRQEDSRLTQRRERGGRRQGRGQERSQATWRGEEREDEEEVEEMEEGKAGEVGVAMGVDGEAEEANKENQLNIRPPALTSRTGEGR